MNKLPKIGLYISKSLDNPTRLYVENSFGDEPENFYIVEVINEADKNNFISEGNELDKTQWESLVIKNELEYQQ